MKFRAIFILLIVILSLFLLGMGQRPLPSCPIGGEPSIDFVLQDLEGNDVRLSDYLGKIVFLNFWATRCPPCRWEMPSMQSLHEKLKGEDFVILAVSIDRAGEPVVKPFIKEAGYTFKVLLDRGGNVADKYCVRSIPTTFIIDKKSVVVGKVIGSRDWASAPIVQEFKRLSQR